MAGHARRTSRPPVRTGGGLVAHTVWSGAISFGLVHVPVKAKAATRQKDIRFVQLHEEDGERIKMRRVCPEHGEVPYEEIVRGYPLGKHEYIVVTDEEFAALEPDRQETIEIEDFVELSEVDPVYFEKSYHLVPEQGGVKAYRLLADALRDTSKVAIGRFVMRNKEHLVAIRVWGEGLVMEMLHFHDEVLPFSDVAEDLQGKDPTKKEREMATRLVESLSGPFEPEQYKDTFRKRMLDMLEGKAEGATVRSVPRAKDKEPIDDLEKALEASLRRLAGQ